jgi:opacity protein-like surface antigen
MRLKIEKEFVCAVMLTILVTLGVCSVSSAQDWSRQEKWEISAVGWFLGGESLSAGGFTAKEDDFTLYGVQLGQNVSENLNLNLEAIYGSIDVKGSGMGITATGEQDTFIFLVNAEYNILTGPLTPFVTGGLGYGRSTGDVTVTDGATTVKVSGEATGLAYTAGGGVRWEVTENIFAKVSYRILWDDSGDDRNGLAVGIGCMF